MFTRVCGEHRRAAVVVLVAVSGTLMAGMAALTIDLGNMYMGRAELQRVADASALAGASIYFSDAGLAGRSSTIMSGAYTRSSAISERNPVLGNGLTLRSSDVTFGRHDFAQPSTPMASTTPWNAVQVRAARTSNSADGPISLFFAGIWGKTSVGMVATAQAAVDDRTSGYKLQGNMGGITFLPFSIPEDGYYDLIQYGPDEYSYNNGVCTEADNIHEVQMYPWKWKSAGGVMGSEGSGNFGVLNIGRADQGLPGVVSQISSGIAPDEMTTTFGTSTLTFYDAAHTQATGPNIYWASGDPGLSAAMQNALAQEVGNVYGFFLNRGLQVNGANTVYAVSGIFFARIMSVDLSGGNNAAGLVVQPVGYTDSWVTTSQYAASTHGTVGRVTLVQ